MSKLSELLINPLKLKLARGSPNYTNYTEDFKEVIDYILCDDATTVMTLFKSYKIIDRKNK